MTDEEIMAKLLELKSALPHGAELGEIGLARYVLHLSDIPRAAFDRAMWLAVDQCRYFPTVAEIRDLAGMPRVATGHQAGQSAWAEVLGCLVSGRWTDLDAPSRAALKALGGSWNVRQADERELGLLKARFLDAYRPPAPAPRPTPTLPPGEGPGKARVMRMVADLAKEKKR